MEAMINEIKGLKISDATARLIACQRGMNDVYDNIMESLTEMYGEYAAEEISDKKCLELFNNVESVIREFIAISISHNVERKNMKAI